MPSESSIFKSALHPLRLTFKTASGDSCKVIFKKGDDLRQDQLVTFRLNMNFLKEELLEDYEYVFIPNLKLELTMSSYIIFIHRNEHTLI